MHYELSVAARAALGEWLEIPGNEYPVAYESVPFDPPSDGSKWLKFDYAEAETARVGLSRKCAYYVGMVQVGIHFAPGLGMDSTRLLAKSLADFFEDGKILINGCYIVEGGEVRPVQKSVGGWFYPVRFYVRYDSKGV